MVTFLKRTMQAIMIIIISIIMFNALLWAGRSDYQEAQHREARLENYETMIKNVNAGNHHLNKKFLNK